MVDESNPLQEADEQAEETRGSGQAEIDPGPAGEDFASDLTVRLISVPFDIAGGMALGAAQSKVVGLTILRGLKLASIGAAVGVGGIFASTRVIRSLLYGASPVDIPTMIGGVLALICVGVLASLVPAQRAARVSPVTALRSE